MKTYSKQLYRWCPWAKYIWLGMVFSRFIKFFNFCTRDGFANDDTEKQNPQKTLENLLIIWLKMALAISSITVFIFTAHVNNIWKGKRKGKLTMLSSNCMVNIRKHPGFSMIWCNLNWLIYKQKLEQNYID